MIVYTVKCDGCGCSFKDLDQAVDFIADELENTFDEKSQVGNVSREYRIEIEEMTEEEFAALPEFNGF